jgi:tRNA U55 pseudouridine synthase TruB
LVTDEKEYLATMRLGYATDTGDLTGQPLSSPADTSYITQAAVNEALEHFRGFEDGSNRFRLCIQPRKSAA